MPANEHVTKLVMAALAKGAVMASFLVAMDVEFVKALAIAIVSACLSGFFLIVSSIYTVRHTRELTGKLEDVKRKLGASKRSADEGEERL